MSYYTTGLITHVLNNDACTVAVADLEGGSMGLMEPPFEGLSSQILGKSVQT